MQSLSGVLWFAVLVLLMHALRDIFGPLLQRRLVKLALAPGVVVFLFFKILSCTVAGARIREIKPFDDKADLLKYDKPSLGGLGEFLIAVVPLACLLVAFALLAAFFPLRGFHIPPLPGLHLLWQAPGRFFGNGWDYIAGFFSSCGTLAGSPYLWLLLYGAVNVLLAGAPPVKDLKHVAIAMALAALVAFAVSALGLTARSHEFRAFLARLFESFTFLFGAGLACVVLSVIAVGSWRLFAHGKSERK